MKKEYKYNLNKILMAMDRSLEIKVIEQMIENAYGIPVSTIRKHRAIPKDSNTAIREDHLAIYAKFFNTTVDALRNYELAIPNTLLKMQKGSKDELRKTVDFNRKAKQI
jgi:hypothetical protein